MSKMMQEAWHSRDTFASVLLTMFLDRFGVEGLEWDPATIALEVEDEFDIELPQLALDKLLVAIQILTTDRFFKQLPDFIAFCNVLDGDPFVPDTFDPADAEEVAWGITEALLIAPPDKEDGDAPFTDEICAYIGAVVRKEGIITPPDVLRIALPADKPRQSIQEFSDDPEMFNAVYDLEAGKTDDINRTIQYRMQLLSEQLSALKLKNGSTQHVAEMIQKSLSR